MPAVRLVPGLIAGLGAAALTLSLVGCGSDTAPENTAAPTTTTPARAGAGSALHYSSFGTEADIDCGDGRALDISGSNNTLRVVGNCASVSITGADNRVQLEKVTDALEVGGLNNTVAYVDGEPDIVNSGTGNRIRRD